MKGFVKYLFCLSPLCFWACQKAVKPDSAQESDMGERQKTGMTSGQDNDFAGQDESSEMGLLNRGQIINPLSASKGAPWIFSGNDKPYPILMKNSYFLMGKGYKSEASYLLRQNGALAKNATLSFSYKIDVVSGLPDFVAMETNNAPNSGTIGIIIFRNYTDEHGRFWFKKRVNLDPGTYTITAPLSDLVNWSSVYGKSADTVKKDFYEALANVKGIGVTFGGGGHYGHGVRVFGGTAKFTILSMKVSSP